MVVLDRAGGIGDRGVNLASEYCAKYGKVTSLRVLPEVGSHAAPVISVNDEHQTGVFGKLTAFVSLIGGALNWH